MVFNCSFEFFLRYSQTWKTGALFVTDFTEAPLAYKLKSFKDLKIIFLNKFNTQKNLDQVQVINYLLHELIIKLF